MITMVSDTPDVESVLFGEAGLAAGLRPGSVVVDMSTISTRAAVEFAGGWPSSPPPCSTSP